MYELAEGATSPTVMPFNNISHPVRVCDGCRGRPLRRRRHETAEAVSRCELADRAAVPRPRRRQRSGGGNAGNVYVTDQDNHKFADDNHPGVWKLAAGASVPTLVPSGDLKEPNGISVDTAGNLYVTDGYQNRVWKLAAARQ